MVILAATQNRPNARDKLARIERLYQAIVSPHLKADDPAHVFLPRSKQINRNFQSHGPQIATKIEQGSIRLRNIKDNEIDLVGAIRS